MADEILPGGQEHLDRMRTAATSGSLEDAFAPGFTDRDPGDGQPAGGAGLMAWWDGFRESFSDVEQDVIHTIATPEHVVTVMQLSGRHTGEWLGYAATGKRFSVRNVQVMRFSGDRAVERWGSTDELGILQQLGLA